MEYLLIGVLAAVVVAVVVYPLISSSSGTHMGEAELDVEVDRYREALKNATLCDACLTANRPGSRYCAECGAALGAGAAGEGAEVTS